MGASVTRTVKYILKGDKGEKGASLRGPQAWSDCAVGYSFQAGNNGDSYKDLVMYSDNYYTCIRDHAKMATNYPTSIEDNNNGYWQLGDKVDLIATKILLATYALVKNLGVEAIDMKDNNGNILFQAKDGNVICKTGTFENINLTGTIKSVSGKIGNLSINSDGLYDGNPTKWNDETYKQNLFSIIPGLIKIQRQRGYFAAGDIANIKVGIGDGCDPTITDDDGFCNRAAYIYRQMNNSANPYLAAIKIISDNVINRNIALELIGSIRAKNGIMDMGRFMNVADNNAVSVIDLSFGTSIVIKSAVNNFSFFLPTLSQIRAQMEITESESFCIPIRIGIEKSSQYGIYLKTQNKASPPVSDAEGGMIVDNDGNEWGSSNISMAKGDVLRLSLTYTIYSGYYAQLDTWMN